MVRLLASVFIAVTTATAAAQPTPDPEAARLFQEGRALADRGKFEEACAVFERSFALDSGIGTQLNLANCHEQLGHLALAWRLFDAAADADKITYPERAKFARDRADALLAKVGVVILELADPEAPTLAVSIGGRAVRPGLVITEVVDPSDVEIEVTAEGAQPFRRTEAVGAGKRVTIAVPALEPARPPGMADAPGGDGIGARRRSRVLLAYGVGGAGALALVGGVLVGLQARSDYNAQFDNLNCADGSPPQCNDAGFDAQSSAVSRAHVGTVLGVGGLALIGAGAVLFFTAPRDVVVTPTATATSAAVTVGGKF